MIILDAQAGRAAGCVLPAFCLPPYRVESSRGESSPASGILWPAGQSVPRRTHAGRRGKTGRTLMLLASDANAGAPQRGLVSGACICICIRDGGCAVRHACRAIEYKGAGTPPSDAGALHATPPIPPIPFGACVRRSGRGHKYPSVPHPSARGCYAHHRSTECAKATGNDSQSRQRRDAERRAAYSSYGRRATQPALTSEQPRTAAKQHASCIMTVAMSANQRAQCRARGIS